ncbi:MAG: hypothetical protein ACLFSA_10335 [Spirochaetaceae bacterium]
MDDFFDTPDETLDVQPIEEEEDALQEETEQEGEQEDPEDEPDGQDQEQGDGQDQADKDQEAADSVDIGELTTSPLKFSGSVTAGVGAGVGLESWPEALAWNDIKRQTRVSGFFTNPATFRIDARPHSYLRFHLKMDFALDENEMSYTGPNIKELFTDYTLADTVFFRAGKQSLTWGSGRLIGNPANLVSDLSSGVGLKMSLPAGPGTLDGVIYSKEAWVDEHVQPYDPKAFAYAGLWESTMGPLTMNLAGHYRIDGDGIGKVGNSLSLSFGLGEVDVDTDFVGHWDTEGFPKNFPGGNPSWEALGRLFWENDDRSLSFLGEYLFDSSVAGYLGHKAGIGVKFPSLASGGWRPSLRWKHAFQDHSGEVVLGTEGTVAPKLKLSVGIPLVYGAPGSVYREELASQAASPFDAEEDDNEYNIPVENVVSLLLSLKLSFSF